MAPATGKNKKKKWSKGKVKDKANNAVCLEDAQCAKIMEEVQKARLITPSVVSERHHLCVSLARLILSQMCKEGRIKLVSKHNTQTIYTRSTIGTEEACA